jgi:hypothetical protein
MNIDLNELLDEWAKDSVLDDLALDNESVRTAKLHAKYLSYLSHYKLKLKHLYNKKEVLRKNLWLYYGGKMTKEQMDHFEWPYDPFDGMKVPLKSDLNRFIDADENYLAIESKIEYAKTVLDTLEEIMNNLRWRHSSIKNIIEWKKFTAGA